ncbi:hypothetical protein AHiyo4_23980 [Arthrobacter sp. Hiyo4]|nr:hypothetical protein AHiyo4_23980 [Arthrobacter sp. Hiyo4]
MAAEFRQQEVKARPRLVGVPFLLAGSSNRLELTAQARRLRTISLTDLPSKRPATLAVTGFITAPS